jgi:hypothetical protein
MVSKNNKVTAAILAVLSFFMVTYVSCSKSNPDTTKCKNVTCRNGGHCNDSSDCICPLGYEDTACGTETVAKYLSNWSVKQWIIGSDSSDYIGTDTFYTSGITRTSTPTTFFITNFNDNRYYNNVLCQMDSINSYRFKIDTISPFQMIYQSYQILSGAGTLNKSKDTIDAIFMTRHKNESTNWQVDTVQLQMIRLNY